MTLRNRGPRPVAIGAPLVRATMATGGRTLRRSDAQLPHRAQQRFGAQQQKCALPGGGSGAARGGASG